MNTKLFTLVELLIVIAIISVLAATITSASKFAIRKAQVTHCHVQMKTLQVALNLFYDTYHKWPMDYSAGLHHDTKTVGGVQKEMNFYLEDGVVSSSGWDNGMTYYERMVRVLQGCDNGEVNVRKISFLPVKGTEGEFTDRWGNNFKVYVSKGRSKSIVIDAAPTVGQQLSVPGLNIEQSDSGKIEIFDTVFIVSNGPDGEISNSYDLKNEDNIYSTDTVWVEDVGHEIK